MKTTKDIDQEYVNLCVASGDLMVRIRAMQADLALMNEKLDALIVEKATLIKEQENTDVSKSKET